MLDAKTVAKAIDAHASLAQRLFDELDRNTREGEGICRASYGVGENFAHRLMAEAARELGLEVAQDPAANTYMTLPGRDRSAPRVLIGSHLDSVINGGNYDGAAGVVSGLVALAAFKDLGFEPARDIAVMGIRAEESAWFGVSYIGSRAALGQLSLAYLDDAKRSDSGRSLADHMAECGADPEALRKGPPRIDPKRVHAFMEVHIEQGPVLHLKGFPIGVVTGIRGNYRHPRITVTGDYGHCGGEPRFNRRDAVIAASAFVSGLDAIWDEAEAAGDDMAFTVGKFFTDAAEHQLTRISGKVEFSLDLRSTDAEFLKRLEERAQALAKDIAQRKRVNIDLGRVTHAAIGRIEPAIMTRLEQGAARLGIPQMRIPSGAAHDSAAFAAAGVPTAMIFVRNDHGSHNPLEAMELDDFMKATSLLGWWLTEGGGTA